VSGEQWKNSGPVENPSPFSTPPVEALSLQPQGIRVSFHKFFACCLLLRTINPLLLFRKRENEIGGTVYEILL